MIGADDMVDGTDEGPKSDGKGMVDYAGRSADLKFERVDVYFDRATSYATVVAAEPKVVIDTMSFPVAPAASPVDIAVTAVDVLGGTIIKSSTHQPGALKHGAVVRLAVMSDGSGELLSDVNRNDPSRRIASFTRLTIDGSQVRYEAILPDGSLQSGTINASSTPLRIGVVPKAARAEEGLVGTYGYQLDVACGGASCLGGL